jgi:hypothetical protein
MRAVWGTERTSGVPLFLFVIQACCKSLTHGLHDVAGNDPTM